MNSIDMGRSRPGLRAFSLLELLVVIAIIAILAGLTFPIAQSLRERGNQSACIGNLESLGQAMRIYRLDEREFPPALYGWIDPNRADNRGKAWADMTPTTFLYPHYIKSTRDYKCPNNPKRFEEPGTATWRDVNSLSPAFTASSVAYMVPLQKQRKQGGGYDLVPVHPGPIRYYLFDSYDGAIAGAQHTNPALYGPSYRRDWASVLVKLGRLDPDSPLLDRELLNRNPQDNTYMTACTFHRSFESDGFTPKARSLDIVLYQDGHAQKVPSRDMNAQGFALEP